MHSPSGKTYIEDTIDCIESIPEISDLELIRTATYYAHQVRLKVFKCMYQGQKVWLKVYDDPRQNPELQNTKHLPQILPESIQMPQVLTGYAVPSDKSKGWYIMEEIDFTGNPNWEEYLHIYDDYRNSLKSVPENFAPHINKPDSGTERIEEKLSKWFNLERQQDQFSEDESANINSELEEIREIFVPKILGFFLERPVYLSHSLFHRGKIHKTKEGQIYATDYAHMDYQYDGYDLAIDIWADSIMGNINSENYENIKPDTISKIESVRSIEIFEDPNHIVYAMIERCLGTLFADIWASNKSESKEQKLSKYNAIVDLLNTLLELEQN